MLWRSGKCRSPYRIREIRDCASRQESFETLKDHGTEERKSGAINADPRLLQVFAACVEDNVTMSSIPNFENHLRYFVQN